MAFVSFLLNFKPNSGKSMIIPSRLFDLLPYQAEKFNLPTMFAAKEAGEWRSYSSNESCEICNKLSAGLLSLGLNGFNDNAEEVDKVAIISNNRPEWMFTDIACQQIGVVLCPVYPTTSTNELEFIFNDAAVKYVFVSSEELFAKVQHIMPNTPSIKGVYTFNRIENALHWSVLIQAANPLLLAKVEEIKPTITPHKLATIIYTSGTTGFPKGVMLSHNNILSNVISSIYSFPFGERRGERVLSFLPLNHIFERMVTSIYLYSGISIYYAESMETIGANLKEIKPHGFSTVPRLLEKVYENIVAKGNEQKGIKKKLFFWALKLGLKYDNINSGGFLYNLQLKLANKIVFSKWREGLGGNIDFIISGGAACQERLLRVFNAGKIPVYEGYGPTENSPVITVNCRKTGATKYGTVGVVINGQEVKLADDGEILVKGPSVMLGYYKHPELTQETIIDGWLHTGDIGEWIDGKYLKITDRKKELFKTSGGKFVAPQPIENKLKESEFIEQVIVVGANQKFAGALIVPSFVNLQAWMKEKNIPFSSKEDAIKNPLVIQHFEQQIASFNVFFNHVEQIRKFELLPAEWSIDTGEMTPKMSLKRKVIESKFKAKIDTIYSS